MQLPLLHLSRGRKQRGRESFLKALPRLASLAITHWCDSLTGARLRSAEEAGHGIGVDFSHQIADAIAR